MSITELPEEQTAQQLSNSSEQAITDATAAQETTPQTEDTTTATTDAEPQEATPVKEVPQQDYSNHSQAELINDFKALVKEYPIQDIKEEVLKIRDAIVKLFTAEAEAKKAQFIEEGGNEIDFYYTTPLKKEFNTLYFDYKEKRTTYYENKKRDLKANLKAREALIEELKVLVENAKEYNVAYNQFKDIKERWQKAGAIEKEHSETTWKNYHHYCDEFYKFLHLNREFRALDYKHNLAKKLKLIDRATELTQQEDVIKAAREIHVLHRIWKEETGPVAREYSEEVWQKFIDLSQVVQDRKKEHLAALEVTYKENLGQKEALVDQISEIANTPPQSHSECNAQIKKIEELKEAFMAVGKVARSESNTIWEAFKEAKKAFNHSRNHFYKKQKSEQAENYKKKLKLVEIAEEIQDSEDLKTHTPTIKRIQSEWKTIGHVPRKDSDVLWNRFKTACNAFFDRVHAERNKENEKESAAATQKEALLEKVKTTALSGSHKEDLDAIKTYIEDWKAIGRVPFKKKNLERKFNAELDKLFAQLNVNRTDGEMLRYKQRVESIQQNENPEAAMRKELYFLQKRIEETQSDIIQQETNLSFFKNAAQDSPLVLDAKKAIQRNKEKLAIWKTKLKTLKQNQ